MRTLVKRRKGAVLDHMCLIHCRHVCRQYLLAYERAREREFVQDVRRFHRHVIEHHLLIIVTIVIYAMPCAVE